MRVFINTHSELIVKDGEPVIEHSQEFLLENPPQELVEALFELDSKSIYVGHLSGRLLGFDKLKGRMTCERRRFASFVATTANNLCTAQELILKYLREESPQ